MNLHILTCILYVRCNICLHAGVCEIENKLIKRTSCECRQVLSLSLHEIESLFVQRANEVPIHRSFPCPTKGLFIVELNCKIKYINNIAYALHNIPEN